MSRVEETNMLVAKGRKRVRKETKLGDRGWRVSRREGDGKIYRWVKEVVASREKKLRK